MSLTKLNDVAYDVPPEMDADRLHRDLGKHFRLLLEAAPARRVTYFDTFDWRVHRAGGSLRLAPGREGSTLSWLASDGTALATWVTRKAPPFVRGFPAGPMRDGLAPVLEMRRLLPVVELNVRSWVLRILDRRDKTIARLQLEHSVARVPGSARVPGTAGGPAPLPAQLQLRPVRGYDKARQRLARFLETELHLDQRVGTELDHALAAVGRRAGDTSSKVVIQLDPKMPAAVATKTIHRQLLAAMRRNEPGTRKDLDSEFLHDYRVALRRSRSALTQIKKVYPEDQVARFKPELAWLGGITGPTRDLDVYLLKMDDYMAQLSDTARPHLEPLVAHLRAEQRRAQRRMTRAMSSRRYRDLLEAWDQFLESPADLETPANAARPIVEVASERIWKVYRRVIADGCKIDDDTSAAPVHDLRIRCKKLRYLMEFFRGFYDQQAIGQVIKSLKRLQDNLGNFNDCEVQRQGLIGFAEDMHRQGTAPVATLMAIGRLADDLEAGQLHERRVFNERFASFSQLQNQQLAKQLFKAR